MRWLVTAGLLALGSLAAGCAELGVVSDGTSISVGTPSHGSLIDGARLPDHGDGFVTREVWRARDNRFGTDELVDLVTAVARRMQAQVPGVKLVVADLSGKGGGERNAFHRSHQSGRDADLLYYMRDARGQPFEPDAMHVFSARARAVDGSGLAIDVPRTWLLVKELITAPEAPVQWIFMYEPIARALLEHAQQAGEPEAVIARARKTLKQPGDSARHDDHLHVRVYCAAADRRYGCVDLGPTELLAEREAEKAVAAAEQAVSAAAQAVSVAAQAMPAAVQAMPDAMQAAPAAGHAEAAAAAEAETPGPPVRPARPPAAHAAAAGRSAPVAMSRATRGAGRAGRRAGG